MKRLILVVLMSPSLALAQQPEGTPQIASRTACEYPELGKRLNHQGQIPVNFTIAADGSVKNATVIDAPYMFPDLEKASIECVSQWKYVPIIKDGHPVEFPWHETLTWRLQKPEADTN